MVDFGESDKMIKIRGKVDRSNTYSGLSSYILLIKEQNITTKLIVSVWLIHFSTYHYY